MPITPTNGALPSAALNPKLLSEEVRRTLERKQKREACRAVIPRAAQNFEYLLVALKQASEACDRPACIALIRQLQAECQSIRHCVEDPLYQRPKPIDLAREYCVEVLMRGPVASEVLYTDGGILGHRERTLRRALSQLQARFQRGGRRRDHACMVSLPLQK